MIEVRIVGTVVVVAVEVVVGPRLSKVLLLSFPTDDNDDVDDPSSV